MSDREPVAELDPRFSSEGATPRQWAEAQGPWRPRCTGSRRCAPTAGRTSRR